MPKMKPGVKVIRVLGKNYASPKSLFPIEILTSGLQKVFKVIVISTVAKDAIPELTFVNHEAKVKMHAGK